MKVYLDKDKVLNQMILHRVKSYKQLAELSGAELNTLCSALSSKRASPEVSWLLADYFDCDIMDLWSVDWERDARKKTLP